MKLPRYRLGDPIFPSESDANQAEASSHVLASYLENQESSCTIKLMEDETGKTVEIPALAMQLLLEILVHTAEGKPVKITPYTKELEIYQAAALLNVSDKYIWDLQDAGKIPYKIVGNSRKMRYQDVIEYKKRMRAEQMKGMDELVAQSQALGLYD
ncbi:DNA-binding protein [Planktothrix sp. FACHB-1355]|uniref:DNA-binding protein n=1 Tax=Aerosakkonema funiforme FACHB-1375 TaxID=2949571 RepID=A0A926ZET0_9CYAN|nr:MULTISPECIES: helix-turn-helix domain-containing protein [Oscillatoriales]MBD2179949.1 DNA-binding protein [Aerosakkonema funiforme FACHB-1375]MBD3559551.1 DNA-binding protein [Planktothrix sp. FACHB-1355]